MTSTEPITIGLVVEANADAETVRTLVSRLLLQHVEWITPDLLPSLLEWKGCEPHEQVALWRNVSRLCKQHKLAQTYAMELKLSM